MEVKSSGIIYASGHVSSLTKNIVPSERRSFERLLRRIKSQAMVAAKINTRTDPQTAPAIAGVFDFDFSIDAESLFETGGVAYVERTT